MMFRLTALCLALTTFTWTVVAEDRSDTDSLRSTYETKFEELDSDNNGQLDEKELMSLPPADLQAFRSHGLPQAGPVPRDVFIAAGVAVAGAELPSTSTTDPGVDPVPGKDAGVGDSAKPTETAVPGKGLHVRNSAKKSHYVPELPSEFSARDKNGDGQIALYEWDRKKYAEFAKLDKNGDGFLTPAELLPKGSLKALYAKASTRAVGKGPAAVSGTPGNTAVASSGDPNAVEGEARSTFVQMDVDKDGSIDETDWGRSRRIRPWFDSAGITVSLPMNADTFVALYRRAKESGGR